MEPVELPRIERVDGRPRLLVDGRPFLILGVQWDCDSCFSLEEMAPLFPHARALAANTAALPVYWREVEPEPGKFDLAMVDHRLRLASENGPRVILLWFATWKNACSFYAPAYVRDNPATYPLARDRAGGETISLCPSSRTTWRRDRDALVALMTHLQAVDDRRTVIMVQIENEPGILGSDRCYCPVCTERFEREGWIERYGVNAAEAFSADAIAGYIDGLAAAAKAIYPLPLYANVWHGGEIGTLPGREYPSGGGVPGVLDLFRARAPHLDLVAPDLYIHGYRDFNRLCRVYGGNGNPLYIAEHSSSVAGRAERNVFYAIGDHGAIGFDPWAIDSPFPGRHDPPLVDPLDGSWGPQAHWLRDSYAAIGRAVEPIVDAQGTDRLFTFVEEPSESGVRWRAAGFDVVVTYHDREGAGRGMIVQHGPRELLAIGLGYDLRVVRSRPDGTPFPIRSAEWGRFAGDEWRSLHPMRRERPESAGLPVEMLEPGVARILLEPE